MNQQKNLIIAKDGGLRKMIMNDKEKQIEEMAREIAKRDCYLYDKCTKKHKHNCVSQDPKIMLESSKHYITIATWLVEADYQKVNENEVVIDKKEYELLMRNKSIEHIQEFAEINGKLCLVKDKMILKEYSPDVVEFIRKETAREILDLLVPDCKVCDENWHSGCLCLRATLAEKIAKQYGVEIGEEKCLRQKDIH